MEWQEIGTFTLTKNWQYTNAVKSRDFKVVYLRSPLLAANSTATIALVDMPDPSSTESTEIFRPQRINSFQTSEIIRFPEPPRNWVYRVGIKQLTYTLKNVFESEVKLFMPVYSSAITFNGFTSSVTVTNISTDNTKSVLLSAANIGKLGSTVTNTSKTAKLYVSLGIPASLTVFDKILNYLETYETPFNWSGEIYGIWDKADTNGNAKVKDFT